MFWLIVIGIVAVIVIVLVTKDNDKIVTLDDVVKNNSKLPHNNWETDPAYHNIGGNIFHNND